MLIRVIDNNTNNTLIQTNTNNWADAMIKYIENYRKSYNNATIEWYYTDDADGRPYTTFKTFH